MKYITLCCIAALLVFSACAGQPKVAGGAPTLEDVLIRKGFVDDNSYRIVCRGYPQQGLEGIQKTESSKRGALLNAYYFVQTLFDDSVAPDRDGKAEKFEVMNDFAVVYYLVTKKGLKKRLRR
jgi:hypothetical protein